MTDTIHTHVVLLSGEERAVPAETGVSLMENIKAAGIDDIPAYCGGNCSCASCHVYVDEAYLPLLPAMSEDEGDLLDGSQHRRAGSRLSCQFTATPALDGIRVTVAPPE
jgi:2Fe-2S ferredoxin